MPKNPPRKRYHVRRFRRRRPGPLYHIANMVRSSLEDSLHRAKSIRELRAVIFRLARNEEFWTGLTELRSASRKLQKTIEMDLYA